MHQPTKIFSRGLLKNIDDNVITPHGVGYNFILHLCNLSGNWEEQDPNLTISKRWKKPEQEYRIWYRSQGEGRNKFAWGEIQNIQVQSDIAFVNCLCKDFPTLTSCLRKVLQETKEMSNSSIHLSKSSLISSLFEEELFEEDQWDDLLELLTEVFIDKNINVSIYK